MYILYYIYYEGSYKIVIMQFLIGFLVFQLISFK